MVCGVASWLIHVTTVPVFTVSVDGSNAKFLIVIAFPPPVEVVGATVVVAVWGEEQPATMQARIKRMVHTEQNTKRK